MVQSRWEAQIKISREDERQKKAEKLTRSGCEEDEKIDEPRSLWAVGQERESWVMSMEPFQNLSEHM